MVMDVASFERQAGVVEEMNFLGGLFKDFARRGNGKPADLLRNIKKFLHETKDERHRRLENTLLSGSSCLTLAVEAASLAHRNDLDVGIIRPKDLLHYCHAALVYGNGETFKISGGNYKFPYVELTQDQVITRLRLLKFPVEFVNHLRGRY